MLKSLTIAAVTLTAFTALSPVPVITGTALAQAACTAAPCQPPQVSGSSGPCTDKLRLLRRVYPEELDGIDSPTRVSIFQICPTESFGIMRSDGNAGSLRQAVAENDAIVKALSYKNYGPNDVIGIQMTSDQSLNLWVHPFGR